MSKVIGYLIGGSVILALGVGGSQSSKQRRAEAMERFEISEAETPILNACTSTMSTYNVEFKTDVSDVSGCACLARELTDEVHPSRIEPARVILTRMIKSGGDNVDSDLESDLMKIQADYKLDMFETNSIMDKLGAAMETCADPRTHWSASQAANAEANMEEVKANFEANASR